MAYTRESGAQVKSNFFDMLEDVTAYTIPRSSDFSDGKNLDLDLCLENPELSRKLHIFPKYDPHKVGMDRRKQILKLHNKLTKDVKIDELSENGTPAFSRFNVMISAHLEKPLRYHESLKDLIYDSNGTGSHTKFELFQADIGAGLTQIRMYAIYRKEGEEKSEPELARVTIRLIPLNLSWIANSAR